MSEAIFRIERCRISGFKSIREADITLGPFNVVIGANGAGKSNLVSYFALLKGALEGRLDRYIGRSGGPNAFLHLGSKQTGEIAAAHTITTEDGTGTLYQRLEFQAPDGLIYSRNHSGRPAGLDRSGEILFGESCSIVKEHGEGEPQPRIYVRLRNGIGVYHFHDTSLTSPIRSAGYVEDNRGLHPDGGNLAAVLFRLRQTNPAAYRRIVGTIRLIAPFFDDFSLAPRSLDPTRILLNWRQVGSDYEFGPHQLSDGTLRAMAIVTLLLQPEAELPKLIVIDEPEIGLHPYAVSVLVSLLRKASHHVQVIVATQSPQLLDECDPEDIMLVEREGQESTFSRPDPPKLREWLEEYSLGEIWRKNVIGGGPH